MITKGDLQGATPPGSSKVGLIILAGGDGSRLGFDGPKGAFVLEGVNKSLFEMVIEKAKRVEAIAIMTSESNHDKTVSFFKENQFFGLPGKAISFFMQSSELLTTSDGKPVLDNEGNPVTAPCGNGDLFAAFDKAKIAVSWKERGIEYVHVIPVDNPLASPYDSEMVATHIKYGVSLVVRGIEKEQGESVGSLVRNKEGLGVIEYTETDADSYMMGYTGIFSITFECLLKLVKISVKWHRVHKERDGQKIIKLEKFVFDYFASIDSFKVLASDRKACFAPIKTGQDVYKYSRLLHN